MPPGNDEGDQLKQAIQTSRPSLAVPDEQADMARDPILIQ